MQDAILVLSHDPALAGLIVRTLRLQQVYAKQLPMVTPMESLLALHPKGIILASPQDLKREADIPPAAQLATAAPVLVLGGLAASLCLHFGGSISSCLPGSPAVTLGLASHPLFQGITGGERVLHDVSCLTLPPMLTPLATATEQVVGFAHESLPLYAMQYPIEHNDPDGARVLQNFATLLCGMQTDWDEHHIIRQAVDSIEASAQGGRVLCAVSGGMDSLVCAKLAHMAVGDHLHCLFVDTGLMREGEAQDALATCKEILDLDLQVIDARESFLRALTGVSTNEDKQRITITLLSQILRKQFADDHSFKTLVLGTNFNDQLRGASLGLQASENGLWGMGIVLGEPIRELFKEEVRGLAAALSLPSAVVNRQAFPASGLALRIMGEVTPQRLELLRAANAIFVQELTQGGHEKRLWQYYATALETPANPGTYVIVLRALQAAQATAYAARLPFDVLERTTLRILEEVPGVRRVIYDLTPSMHYTEQE